MAADLLLDVRGLKTWFHTRDGVVGCRWQSICNYAGGDIGAGGESGSGKALRAFTLMRLVDALAASRRRTCVSTARSAHAVGRTVPRLRGEEIAMIFQDPMMTLNPTLRVDTQMIEAVRAHQSCIDQGGAGACGRGAGMVGIPSPAERLLVYPHHLSGGMRHRVAIAIAL